ncbi:MAG: hypothetical protein ACFFF9_16695 [Candidatus Thorarchaeota archaeon]
MRIDTAQRILWFAMVFIVLMVIVLIGGAIVFTLAFTFIDLGTFISEPSTLAFLQANPLFIPAIMWAIAIFGIIYLIVVYLWRKDPMAHRTGFTILGIIQLIVGFSLVGLLLLLPGLLLEENQ